MRHSTRSRPQYKKSRTNLDKVNKGISRTSHTIMALLMDISSLVSMANMIILVALLVVYSKIYIKTRATFTVGLAIFAGMLMLHNGI